MPLGLVPEILDAVDVVFPVGKQFGMVDPVVFETGNIQHIVRTEGIGIHDAIGNDLVFQDGLQGLALHIGNNLCIYLAATLQKPEYRHFPRSSSPSLALTPATKVALVYLDLTAQRRTVFAGLVNYFAQTMKIIRRCGLVDPNQESRCPSRGPSYKMLRKPLLLLLAQTALPHPNHPNS